MTVASREDGSTDGPIPGPERGVTTHPSAGERVARACRDTRLKIHGNVSLSLDLGHG
jgi:hypothetical protein